MLNTRNKLIRYLARSGGGRPSLQAGLEKIQARVPDIVIFGGMVRDFGLGQARQFASDIDMVTTAPANEIRKAIAQFDPVMNKFGGFRFFMNNRLFDIWSLEDTWAIREGHVAGTALDDLCRTTFFNLDAAFFEFREARIHAHNDYDELLLKRILDVNLLENPNPRQMALRAVRMSVQKDLYLAPALAAFVLQQLYGQALGFAYESYVRQLHEHVERAPGTVFGYEPQLRMW